MRLTNPAKYTLRKAICLGSFTALTTLFLAPNASASTPLVPACAQGEFCYWASENYPGEKVVLDLARAQTSTCIPLPDHGEARSFANFREHEITVYEGGHCSTEGDFRTYPAASVVPESPFVARAVQIWQ